MKPSKHKQLPSNSSQHQHLLQQNSCKQISKKPSIKQQSHLPISSSNNSVSIKNQSKHNQSYIYESCSKQRSINYGSSPYMHLPSVTRENNENVNLSNVSSRVGYYQGERNLEDYDSGSIYEQLITDSKKRPFETEESQLSNYYVNEGGDYYKSNNNYANYQIYTKRKQSTKTNNYSQQQHSSIKPQTVSRSKCEHKSPNFTKNQQTNQQQYYSGYNNLTHQDNANTHTLSNLNKSQQMIKKHINQKLDRVCEKVQNLSREKDYGKSKIDEQFQSLQGASVKWGRDNYSTNPVNLCYSSIVYEKNQDIAHTPKTLSKQNYPQQKYYQTQNSQQIYQDNRIQHRISSPPKPTHQQLLQSHIIQMDKKISSANGKILKLQEQLLKEKQTLIKKEKQWLLRQNELLNWIQANQVQGQFVEEKNNNQSPKRYSSDSLKKSKFIGSNIIVDDCEQNQLRQEIQQYKETCDGLIQLISQVLTLVRLNDNWLGLMNRTLSHELPGTAFRVKEEMNINKKSFIQLEKNCNKKIILLDRLHHISFTNTQLPTNQHPISSLASLTQSPQTINPSTNQSQVFLLQSYCPPVSQHYQIQTTKRNTSNMKPSQQRKSLSCLSESKSATTTNKKLLTSTHKKSFKKDLKQIEHKKPNDKPNHSLYQSRKSQYYCDEVFYSRAKQITSIQPQHNLLYSPSSQLANNNQLYYLLSLQAQTIQTLIPQQNTTQTIIDFQQEENLLSGMDV